MLASFWTVPPAWGIVEHPPSQEGSMPARIIVESGTASPPVLELIEGQEYSFGRSSTSALCLRDRHASREHTVLSFVNGSWVFQDLGPTNGTRIDGRRVEADTSLLDNQIITIGD